MIKRSLSMILLILSPWVSGCSIETVENALKGSSVYASFEQQKIIKGLSRPLLSSGVLWLSPQDQLVWQLLKPIKSTTVMSLTGIKQFNKNDELLNIPNNPVVDELSVVFINLLRGDVDELKNAFSTAVSCNGESWKLTLMPATTNLSRLFNQIIVEGEKNISRLSIEEIRGDVSVIQLSDLEQRQPEEFEKYFARH